MRRASALACVAVLCLAGGALLAVSLEAAAAKEALVCPPPARALRYPDVEPIFSRHCASCHDARKGDNRAAQRVFEMSRYPFATERPATLLTDLRGMFGARKALTAPEKCAGLAWLDGGGRDAEGKPPRWR